MERYGTMPKHFSLDSFHCTGGSNNGGKDANILPNKPQFNMGAYVLLAGWGRLSGALRYIYIYIRPPLTRTVISGTYILYTKNSL